MSPPESRIPIRFAARASASPGDVVLATTAVPVPDGIGVEIWNGDHGQGCACCGGRSRLATVLLALFVSAMRGDRPRFSAIVADLDEAGEAALREALCADHFLAARFVAA